jgi:23S rRNA pseudouridine2605 synthase
MTEGARLHKALADLGLGSRREIEGWIEAGRVTVNGRAAVLGQRIARGDRVAVDGKPVRLPDAEPAAIRVIAYNKPEGEICSRRDPEGRPTVFAALPRLRDGRWIIVGRLDLNTTGLLLATDSGELANRLMHPGSSIEREYLVRVLGEVDAALLARLRAGVLLDDGMAAFDDIRELKGEGSNRWFTVVLREGRNREVRRLWESQGCKVSRLKRVRFGTVALGPRERRGTCRELDEAEVRALCASVGLIPPAPARAGAPERPGARRRDAAGAAQRSPAPRATRGARGTYSSVGDGGATPRGRSQGSEAKRGTRAGEPGATAGRDQRGRGQGAAAKAEGQGRDAGAVAERPVRRNVDGSPANRAARRHDARAATPRPARRQEETTAAKRPPRRR